MRVLKLSIENFMSIGSATISFDSQGLVLIEGENTDASSFQSNGAGKSAMFVEALLYCLFDITVRGIKKDAVINRKIGSGTRVTTLLDDNGQLIAITRYRQHGKFGNSVQLIVNGVER